MSSGANIDSPERTRRLAEADLRHLWHPFTQMQEYGRQPPLIIECGEGAELIDLEGNRYLDGVSSLWINVHGHRRREIDAAVVDQIGRIAHSTLLGISNVPAIELAARLAAAAPGALPRVFFSDDGSTAVEAALKIALQYWRQRRSPDPKRNRFIALTHAYHGDTIGAVSVGGISLFHERFRPLLFDALRIDAPYCYRCPLDRTHPECDLACLDSLDRVLRDHGPEAAALIVEPMVMGAAGMIVQPPGYLSALRERCDRHGLLLIADEVATGFGRTGRMFACEHEGIVPDLLALAKGITGGYLPLAATLATEEIYEAFLGEREEKRTFFHGHSYTGNPLACRAALASLDIFDSEGTLASMQEKITRLTSALNDLRDLPHVGEIRQLGFMVGIELVWDLRTREPFPVEGDVGVRVMMEARSRGAVIRPLGDVIVLMPPLCISVEQIDRLVQIVRLSIAAALESGDCGD